MSAGGDLCGKGGFTFVWTIENFRHCVQTKGSELHSDCFLALGITWSLRLYPRGNNKDNVECCLRKDYHSSGITIDCEVCVCTINGGRLGVDKKENLTLAINSNGPHTAPFERQIIDHLSQDTLVIHCHLWKSGSDRSETPVHCHQLTRINVQKKMFSWKIAEFSSVLLKEEKVWKLEPVEQGSPTLTFKMSLTGKSVDCASIQIVIDFQGILRRTFFTCIISVLDLDGDRVKYMTDEQWLNSNSAGQVTFPHFLTRRELMANRTSYLPGDDLTLKCEVTLSDNNHKTDLVVYGQSTPVAVGIFHKRLLSLPRVPDQDAPHTLRGDLGLLYKDGAPYDFELSAGGKAFPVHSLLLGARSPVFRNMFQNDMLEKNSETLCITDLDPDTLNRMMQYIYTDSVPDIEWQDAAKLYYAADKYQLPALRQRCSALLCDRLDPANSAEILALADRHQDSDLKGAVQDFVFNCGRSALAADQWMLLEKENPQLAIETFRHIVFEKFLSPSPETPPK